jgi:hypothetical protein
MDYQLLTGKDTATLLLNGSSHGFPAVDHQQARIPSCWLAEGVDSWLLTVDNVLLTSSM